mgnify:CR=1 FL=1
MTSRFSIYLLLIPVGLTVLFDEWLKSFALRSLPQEINLVEPSFINFAVHKNFGLAFDLPFRLEFVILISMVIGFGLLHAAWKSRNIRPEISFACLTIVLGALGNLFDRVTYGFTVDYIIFFGRSAINFSDAVIVLGILSLLLFSSKKKEVVTNVDNHPVDNADIL